MDFDEYEYLEKTVENSDQLQEANATSEKRKNDEDVYYRNDENKKHKGDEDSDQRHRSKRDTDEKERYREKEKDRVKDRSDKVRESERLDRGSKDREKDKDRHRDRDNDRYKEWDWDREKSRDKEREYDRDREKSKSKSRNPDHYHDRESSKSRSRNPDHYHDRERSKSRSRNTDYYHDRERVHSRSRERDRTRDVERGRESREREKEFRHSRERREEKERSLTKEPEADLERDQRTVFAYQLCLKANEYDVYEFFSKAGKVRDVRLIMDRNSRRSKGVGYIEFYDVMSVPSAIALSGQILKGQPVMVKPSEAEKNLVQPTPSTGALTGPNSGMARRLYVGNLHFNIKEDQLRQVFEPFGAVEVVQLPVDPETGYCKGFGFVQYARLEDAQSAQQALNGVLELAGRIIKVSAVSDQLGVQDSTFALGELDDDEGGGLSLTARSRAILMQKLDRTGTVTSLSTPGIVAPLVNPNSASIVSSVLGAINPLGIPALANALQAAEPVGAPTECLLLKNMFDPKTETEPDFDLDIKEDALQECSKFGTIKHIFVDKNSEGHVYLRFESLTASLNAQSSLHGRWFAGRMIATQFWTVKAYEAKFPDSK